MAAPFEFANLAPYQQAVANQLLEQSRIDPLQEMIKAANAGRDFRDAPRIAQQKALSEQLALEIQRANLAALDPNSPKNRMNMAMDQARLEALRRSVPTDLENAIQQSAQLALARQQGVVGAPQVAGMPATLPALPVTPEAQRAILATPDDAPLFNETISPLNIPMQVGPGAVFDPQTAAAMQRQAVQEKQRQALELIDARAKSRGFKTYVNKDDPTDIISLDATERPPDNYVEVAKGKGSGSGAGGGGGGLKPPTGEETAKFRQGLDILAEVKDTIDAANKIEKSGKFPGSYQIGVNQFLARRPQDMPGSNLIPGFESGYAVVQNLARGSQTNESRDLQMRKAYLASSILRMQAGLSQTMGEAININPYTPSETDTFESLLDKLNRLDATTVRSLKNFKRVYPTLHEIQTPELGDDLPSPSTPVGGQPSSGRSFTGASMEEAETNARKAGFKTGIVILNGVPRILE